MFQALLFHFSIKLSFIHKTTTTAATTRKIMSINIEKSLDLELFPLPDEKKKWEEEKKMCIDFGLILDKFP